ncbi:MAG TPA: adenylate/guanylate cyclase domain-containing protein [Mycobacteriales bacterium]|nr:adenylate/guanylate cyclase domain-containing protein [Mycobacteriales bacterium]
MGECPACGTPVGTAKFCPECGAKLAADLGAPANEVRKTVTVVFCDVVGSTALGERLDPEAQRGVITRYFAEMRRVLELHGGRVEKFIGDAVMAVFGVPRVHEDDALRAVRAAAGMQAALDTLNEELSASYGVELCARIGVNTGEVVVGDGDRGTVATGDAVNTAARLEQAAGPGEVLLGEPTYRLVRDLVEVEPVDPVLAKGKSEPVPAWRLLAVPDGTGRVERPGDGEVPFVGRERELRLLRQGYERAADERILQLLTVLGVAGTGKTRLVQEFLSGLPPQARVLHGRCLSYGEGIVFWPLTEILRAAAELRGDEDDREARARLVQLLPADDDREWVVDRLAPLAGLPGRAASAEETHTAARHLVTALASERPLVLVVDDLHWAQAPLLDLLDDVVDLTRDVPVVLLCTARPEFQEMRVGWGSRALNSTAIHLSPLTDGDVGSLIGELLAGAPVDPDLVAAVAEASGGNALFVGQLVAMLRDDGRIRLIDGVWTVSAALTRVDLPPSISALLSARLDRLPADERRVLEAASVMGSVFYGGAIPTLLNQAEDQPPTPLLTNLLRRDLIRQSPSDIHGESAYRFLHVLVRESAYGALPKAERARLHAQFASWLDQRTDHASGDLDEFVGYHLEQAYHLRIELAPPDAATTALGAQAADRLAAAAQALRAVSPGTAADGFRRAYELLPAGPRRAWLAFHESQARYEAGDFVAAMDRVGVAHAEAEAAGDEELAVAAWLGRGVIGDQLGSGGDLDHRLRVADEAETRWGAAASHDLTLAILSTRLVAFNLRAMWAGVAQVAREGLRLATAAEDAARVEHFLGYILASFAHGPDPADEALRDYDVLLANRTGSSSLLTPWLAVRSTLLAMLDREEEAREVAAEALARLAEEPGRNWEPVCLGHIGDTYAILGDRSEGMRCYGRAVAWLEGHGEMAWLSTYGAMYALNYGDDLGAVEAHRLLELARAGTVAEDVVSQALVRLLDAQLLLRAGNRRDAPRVAGEALAWIDRCDQRYLQGLCYYVAAEIRAATGDGAGAAAAVRQAVALFAAKGDAPDTRRAQARLSSLEATAGLD